MQEEVEKGSTAQIEEIKAGERSSEEFPVSVNWVQKMQFVGRDEHHHSIVIDATEAGGGENTGPTPMRLLLMAVACCTAMDVVGILLKSRQRLTGLSVSSRGIQNNDYPRYLKEIHLRYVLEGKDLEKDRVERAIRLSEEKYCSVGATVSGKAKIFIKYEIRERQ